MAIDPSATKTAGYLKRLVDVTNPNGGTSPIYQAVQPQIALLTRVWMLLPGNGNPMANEDPASALEDLVGFGVVPDLQAIIDASDKVTSAFNTYFGAEIQAFAELVGEETITANTPVKIFVTRRDDEVTEHNKNVATATEFRGWITEAADKLKISLVGAPVETKKVKKQPGTNLFVKLFTVPVNDGGKHKTAADLPEFGWQTPPVFDVTSPKAQLFVRMFKFIKKLEKDVFLQSIEASFGVTEPELQVIFSELYAQTNLQIEQSQKVLAFIQKEYQKYQDGMEAGLELQSNIVDIGKFFGFTVGKASKKAAK